MSKGDSGYFSNTSGKGKALIAEVEARGDKITASEVIGITKTSGGQIIWLEKGHSSGKPSGLAHIIEKHGNQFNDIGIETNDIADFVLTAVSKGRIVGYQGKSTTRPVYEVEYNGVIHRVAVTAGSNGYIVGANPSGNGGIEK